MIPGELKLHELAFAGVAASFPAEGIGERGAGGLHSSRGHVGADSSPCRQVSAAVQ